MKKILVLLSLLGLLLFLAPPALGDTRGGADYNFSHVEPNEDFVVLRIVDAGGKTYAIAEKVNGVVVQLPYDAVNYDTQRVTHTVDAPVIGQVYHWQGSWTAKTDGKTYHGLKSHKEAIARVLSMVMEQIDATAVPDTGGPALRTIALAGTALLVGGSLLLWRIVLGEISQT